MLDNGSLDESRSDWIYDEILMTPIDSIHDPYNLFPLNPWVIPWISLLNDEMIISWMIWEDMTIPFEEDKILWDYILGDGILETTEIVRKISEDKTILFQKDMMRIRILLRRIGCLLLPIISLI
jgi:hypothetical protein